MEPHRNPRNVGPPQNAHMNPHGYPGYPGHGYVHNPYINYHQTSYPPHAMGQFAQNYAVPQFTSDPRLANYNRGAFSQQRTAGNLQRTDVACTTNSPSSANVKGPGINSMGGSTANLQGVRGHRYPSTEKQVTSETEEIRHREKHSKHERHSRHEKHSKAVVKENSSMEGKIDDLNNYKVALHYWPTCRYAKMKMNKDSLKYDMHGFKAFVHANTSIAIKGCWQKEIVPRSAVLPTSAGHERKKNMNSDGGKGPAKPNREIQQGNGGANPLGQKQNTNREPNFMNRIHSQLVKEMQKELDAILRCKVDSEVTKSPEDSCSASGEISQNSLTRERNRNIETEVQDQVPRPDQQKVSNFIDRIHPQLLQERQQMKEKEAPGIPSQVDVETKRSPEIASRVSGQKVQGSGHPPESSITTSQKSSPGKRKAIDIMPCMFYFKGHCRNGTQCRFKHSDDRAETEEEDNSDGSDAEEDSDIVCRYYIKGYCQFGDNCYYKHCDVHDEVQVTLSVGSLLATLKAKPNPPSQSRIEIQDPQPGTSGITSANRKETSRNTNISIGLSQDIGETRGKDPKQSTATSSPARCSIPASNVHLRGTKDKDDKIHGNQSDKGKANNGKANSENLSGRKTAENNKTNIDEKQIKSDTSTKTNKKDNECKNSDNENSDILVNKESKVNHPNSESRKGSNVEQHNETNAKEPKKIDEMNSSKGTNVEKRDKAKPSEKEQLNSTQKLAKMNVPTVEHQSKDKDENKTKEREKGDKSPSEGNSAKKGDNETESKERKQAKSDLSGDEQVGRKSKTESVGKESQASEIEKHKGENGKGQMKDGVSSKRSRSISERRPSSDEEQADRHKGKSKSKERETGNSDRDKGEGKSKERETGNSDRDKGKGKNIERETGNSDRDRRKSQSKERETGNSDRDRRKGLFKERETGNSDRDRGESKEKEKRTVAEKQDRKDKGQERSDEKRSSEDKRANERVKSGSEGKHKRDQEKEKKTDKEKEKEKTEKEKEKKTDKVMEKEKTIKEKEKKTEKEKERKTDKEKEKTEKEKEKKTEREKEKKTDKEKEKTEKEKEKKTEREKEKKTDKEKEKEKTEKEKIEREKEKKTEKDKRTEKEKGNSVEKTTKAISGTLEKKDGKPSSSSKDKEPITTNKGKENNNSKTPVKRKLHDPSDSKTGNNKMKITEDKAESNEDRAIANESQTRSDKDEHHKKMREASESNQSVGKSDNNRKKRQMEDNENDERRKVMRTTVELPNKTEHQQHATRSSEPQGSDAPASKTQPLAVVDPLHPIKQEMEEPSLDTKFDLSFVKSEPFESTEEGFAELERVKKKTELENLLRLWLEDCERVEDIFGQMYTILKLIGKTAFKDNNFPEIYNHEVNMRMFFLHLYCNKSYSWESLQESMTKCPEIADFIRIEKGIEELTE